MRQIGRRRLNSAPSVVERMVNAKPSRRYQHGKKKEGGLTEASPPFENQLNDGFA
ncbi:MAG: hypothetical protein ABGZ23_06945 [Fuerstiella sp.]